MEELLFALINFESFTKDMSMLDKHRINQFQMTLRAGTLTEQQKKKIFFNTFPKSWRTDYMSSAHDIHKETLLQVKTYMALKKLDMDKAFKKKKHEKEQKEEKDTSSRRSAKF